MNDFSIIDPLVSVFENIKDPKNVKTSNFSEVIARIKNPEKRIKDIQTEYRKTKDTKIKNQLPAFIASGTFTQRNKSGFKAASGLMVLDFDKFPDPETLQAARLKLMNDAFVTALFISPSGNGLKAIINIPIIKNDAEFKKIFQALSSRYNSPYFDESTSDISRLCFFAFDAEIYLNECADVFQPNEISECEDSETFERLLSWMKNSGREFIDGNRNKFVFDLAGACCRYGIEKETALDMILDEIYISEDFPLLEIKNSIKSAYKKSEFDSESFDNDFEAKMRKFADAEALEASKTKKNEFPISILPARLQEIIISLNETLNFPNDFTATSMLYAASVCNGKSCKVKFQNGWTDIGSFYFALVGKAGTIKTHPLNFALKPIKKRDADAYNDYVGRKLDFDYLRSLSKKERDEAQSSESEIDQPKWDQHLVSDFTPEALIDVLAYNKRGIGVYVDELASWFKNFNRYNKGSEEQFWLSVWSGNAITLNRKTSMSSHIPEPFISVIGTIQDSVLSELADNRTENGFLDRILYAFPDDQEKKAWNSKELDENIFSEWDQILNKILKLEVEPGLILEFEPEAKNHLMEWQREITDFLNKPENDVLRSIYAKLETYAIRFSLLMELLYFACNESKMKHISLRSVKAALELIQYFSKTSMKAHSILSNSDPISKLPLMKQRVFNALPEDFKTSEGYKVALQNEMPNRSFDDFITNEKLFLKVKKGFYKKIII